MGFSGAGHPPLDALGHSGKGPGRSWVEWVGLAHSRNGRRMREIYPPIPEWVHSKNASIQRMGQRIVLNARRTGLFRDSPVRFRQKPNACSLGCRRSAFPVVGAGTAVGHTGVKISASLTLGGVGSIIAIVMRITPFVPYPEPQGGRLKNLRCDLERSIRRQTCGQAWRLGRRSGRGLVQ